jgi:hypothetical protein
VAEPSRPTIAAASATRGRAAGGSHRAAMAAIVGVGAALALVALAVVGYFLAPVPDPSARVLEWWTLAWVGFPLTGALIATRRPDTRIGWMLIGIGVAMALSRLTGLYLVRAHVTMLGALPLDDTLVALLIVLGVVGDVGAFLLVGVALLRFPADVLGRRWQIAVVGALIAAGFGVVGAVFNASVVLDDGSVVPNPLAGGWITDVAPVLEAAQLGVAVFLLLALGNLVLRYRRGDAILRLQLKWLAYPVAVLLAAAVPLLLLLHDEASVVGAVLWTLLFVVCFNGMAVTMGMAVLRHRLYDIDRVMSRTAAYGLVTGVLVGVYAVAVVTLGRFFAPLTTGSEAAVAASTLLVAALFQPLRRGVQAAVDRRFNRAQYDAQRTVEDFAARLRDEVDLDDLRDRLVAAVGESLEPQEIQIWLAPRNGAGTVRSYQ